MVDCGGHQAESCFACAEVLLLFFNVYLICNYCRTKVLPGAMEIVSGSMASVSQVDISSLMKCGRIMKNRKS